MTGQQEQLIEALKAKGYRITSSTGNFTGETDQQIFARHAKIRKNIRTKDNIATLVMIAFLITMYVIFN